MTPGNALRLGLLTGIAAALFFSLVVVLELGLAEGLLCLLGTSALIAVSLPLVFRWHGEIIEPIWLVVPVVALGVTAKTFYLYWGPRPQVAFLLLGKQPGEMLFATLVIAVGLLCLAVGYLFGNVRWRLPGLDRLASREWHRRRLAAVVVALAVVGLACLAAFIAQLDLSYDRLADLSSKRFLEPPAGGAMFVRGYLRWGIMALEIAFYLVFVDWVRGRRRLLSASGIAVCLLAALAAVFPLLASVRLAIVLMVLRSLVVWIGLRGEPKLRTAVVVAVAGLVTLGAMLSLRRGSSDWQEIRAYLGPRTAVDATVGGRYLLDLTKTAHTIAAVPEVVDYQYGKTLVTWLVAPIPRSWWPQKPHLGTGDLAVPVFRIRQGGVPVGIVGELYLNFGLAGVFIGMLAVGFLLRSVYSTLRPRFTGAGFVLIYAVIATRLCVDTLSATVSGSMTRLLKELVPLLIVIYLCGSGGDEQPAGAASAEGGTRSLPPAPP